MFSKAKFKSADKIYFAFGLVFSSILLLLPFFRENLLFWSLPFIFLFLSREKLFFPLALFAFAPILILQTAKLLQIFTPLPFLHLLLPWLLLLPFLKKLPSIGSFQLDKLSFLLLKQMTAITLTALIFLVFWRMVYPQTWFLPKNPLLIWSLPLLALINAFLEEISFRGLVQSILFKKTGSFWIANLLQALWFGAMHYASGFPAGFVGFVLAGTYGAALGQIRFMTNSLGYCIIMHFLADLTIANLLIFT